MADALVRERAIQSSKSPPRSNRRPFARIPCTRRLPALKEATSVHPYAVWIAAGAMAWFVVAAWIGFAGDLDAAVSIAMVAFINVMLIGLLAGGGWYSRNMMEDRAVDRTFGAFLRGQVDTATGTISGREAFLQIAGMPVILALGGSVIVAIAVSIGVGG